MFEYSVHQCHGEYHCVPLCCQCVPAAVCTLAFICAASKLVCRHTALIARTDTAVSTSDRHNDTDRTEILAVAVLESA